MYENETLYVSEGFINSIGSSFNQNHNWGNINIANVYRITFTGQITAGQSLNGLFSHFINLTQIKGLNYFDIRCAC